MKTLLYTVNWVSFKATGSQYCRSCCSLFAAGILHNNSGNSGRLPVVGIAVLPGHTVAAVHSQSVGILWLLGIPGCSCSTGCKQRQCHTVVAAAVAVAVGCMTVC